MRTFNDYNGNVAHLRELDDGRVRIRVRNRLGATLVSEIAEDEDEALEIMRQYGDGIWIEKAV